MVVNMNIRLANINEINEIREIISLRIKWFKENDAVEKEQKKVR